MKEHIEALETSGKYLVLERFEAKNSYNVGTDKTKKHTAVYLDVETTGLNPEKSKVIELAMVPFTFDQDGNIYDVLPEFASFQDPGESIPEEITILTGITNEMVQGKSIDLEKVSRMLSNADLIISHNARFDRPFVENLSDDFKDKFWACSIADVDWKKEGIESAKLDYLAFKYGFFYDAHRAVVDCQVGIDILSRKLPLSEHTAMNALLKSARRTDVRIFAVGSSFDKKDLLKERGYYWSPGNIPGKKYKAWYIDLAEDKVDDEIQFLEEQIFEKNGISLPQQKINGKLRYSSRI